MLHGDLKIFNAHFQISQCSSKSLECMHGCNMDYIQHTYIKVFYIHCFNITHAIKGVIFCCFRFQGLDLCSFA